MADERPLQIPGAIKAGAVALHIEDEQAAKRCGHRPNKSIVATEEMVDQSHAAVDARTDESFVIMARTDALANEGLERAIERCQHYIEAGADVIFAEAITDPDEYRRFTGALDGPVLANMTEFGRFAFETLLPKKKAARIEVTRRDVFVAGELRPRRTGIVFDDKVEFEVVTCSNQFFIFYHKVNDLVPGWKQCCDSRDHIPCFAIGICLGLFGSFTITDDQEWTKYVS